MKKGVLLISLIMLASQAVFGQEQATQSLSLVFFLLSMHTVLIFILFIVFYRLYRHHIPELFKSTKQEIQDEKVAYKHHYSEHTVEILHKYISYYTRHGYSISHLRKELEKQGYQDNDITEAIKRYAN